MRAILAILFLVCEVFALTGELNTNINSMSEKFERGEAEAMYSDAMRLSNGQNYAGAAKLFLEIEKRFANSTSEAIGEIVALSIYNAALSYDEQNSTTAALETYQRFIDKFQHKDKESLKAYVASSIYNRAEILRIQNSTKAAINEYDKLIERYWGDGADYMQRLVSSALVGLMECAIDIKDEALINAAYEKIALRFANSPIFAQAMLLKGDFYEKIDKRKQSAIYQEFLDKFENDKDINIRVAAVQTMSVLQNIYYDLNESAKFEAICNRATELYANDTNSDIIEAVTIIAANKLEFDLVSGKTPEFNAKTRFITDKTRYSQAMYEFLELLYKSDRNDPLEAVKIWREKYADVDFKMFSFDELDGWAKELKEPQKSRVEKCLEIFKELARAGKS